MDDDERRAAIAETLERSRVMLDPVACSETIAAETAQPRVHPDDGYSCDWAAGMPKPEAPAPVQRKLTDAETAQLWQRYIDAAVSAALAEHKTLADARQQAVGKALGEIRRQLREEIVAAVGELRADLFIGKAHERREPDRGAVIDLPAILPRDRRDAG